MGSIIGDLNGVSELKLYKVNKFGIIYRYFYKLLYPWYENESWKRGVPGRSGPNPKSQSPLCSGRESRNEGIMGIRRRHAPTSPPFQVLQYAGHRWSILVFPNLFLTGRS